jgi:hypothetical protein
MQPDDFFLTIRVLADANIELILVGGLAAVAGPGRRQILSTSTLEEKVKLERA